jgi:hypothetical protein
VRRLVAVLAIALLAAACGSSKHNASGTTAGLASPGPAVQRAVAKTAKAGSEHVVVSATTSTSGQHVSISGSGDFDSAKRLGKLHATLGLGGVQTEIDEVLSGSTVYVSSQLFASFLPAGKQWLKIDLAAAGKALGVDTSVLGAQDPASALAQLKAIADAKRVGGTTIDGVETTRYRGSIDVSKLPKGSSALLGQAGATVGPIDVWVGADGYVHRVRIASKASSGTGNVAKTVLTTTFSRFGEGVVVATPADSDTVDSSTLSIPGLTG